MKTPAINQLHARAEDAGGFTEEAPGPASTVTQRAWAAGLVATKLVPPSQAISWIDRLHILRSFTREAERRQVVIVTAPAGYGKTVLICQYYQWLTQQGKAVGWLSLDHTENDPATLLSYLIAAIGSRVPSSGADASLDLAGIRNNIDVSLNALLAGLAAWGGDFYLFLDDAHNCRDDATHQILNSFVKLAPENLHFIIASREPPRLPLGRLKAQGKLGIVDWTELLFQRDEAEALLRSLAGPSITDKQIKQVFEATEGWAMGLQLAALALNGRENPADIVAFSGRFGSVAEYLAEDVLALKSPATIDFLMRSSVLGRFSAEICNAVLGIANAAEIIEELDRSNTFLFSLDPEKTWFRYHNLFQDFLRKRLRDRFPDEMGRLLRASSQWFREKGHYRDALDMAHATEDVEYVAATLSSICDGLFQAGQLHLLRDAMTRLPLDIIARYPRLALSMIWTDDIFGNLDQAEHLFSILERSYGENPSLANHYAAPGRLDEVILHRRMMSALSKGEVSAANALCQQLLATPSFADAYLIASVRAAQIFARSHLFDCEGITGRAEQIIDSLPEGGLRNGSLWANCIVGLAHERRGEMDLARLHYSNALTDARSIGTQLALPIRMPAVLLAQLCYEMDEIAAARALLDPRAHSMPAIGLIDQFSSEPIIQSRLALLCGDRKGATKLLDDAIDLFTGKGLERVRKALVGERVRQAAVEGQSGEIRALAARNGITLESVPNKPAPGATTWDLIDALIWCRVAVSTGKYRIAASVLRYWIDFCRARNCERPATQMTVQLAQIKMLDGALPGALKLMKASIVSGLGMGLKRTFLDEGSQVQTLLSALYDESAGLEDEHRAYLRNLLDGFAGPRTSIGRADVGEIENLVVTPLTGREIEILVLASRGIKGRYMAAQLGITEGTVKWYMQQIFDKLNVRNRPRAVERARELGILP